VLLDLLLPSLCPLCRADEGPLLCAACRAQLPPLEDPCPWCAAPRGASACAGCSGAGLPHLDRVVAALAYVGPSEGLVAAAKAFGSPAAVRAAAELMPALPPDLAAGATVVAVPAAPGRRPGPHLASACARVLARRQRLPLALRLLRQVRPAAPQHQLGREERRRNVEGLFGCRGPAPARVVLVDDLCTSGATASAAAAVLRAAGARQVALAVLARTPLAGRRG
jgi:predicted amidophosphoribosyltransferase